MNMVKNIIAHIVKPLKPICNVSFNTGIFLNQMKTAKVNFLCKYNILSPSQYRFRRNMSTSHALLELVEEITTSLDKNKYVISIFVDHKKAFDSVNHNILAKKMVLHINGL